MAHLPVPGPASGCASSRSWPPAPTAAPRSTCSTWSSRLDRDFYDVSVVSLSPGSAVRKLQRPGIDVTVIDEPDDAIATGILAAHLADIRADVVHNHMYRAEIVGTKAAIALGEAGHRRPWVISTVHSSRVRPAEDQEELRRLTPPINHLVVVSNAIDAEGGRGGPDGRAALAHLQRRRPRPVRPPGAVLHAPRRVRHGARARRSWASWAAWSSRRATRRCSRRGRSCWRRARRLPDDRRRGEPARRAPRDRPRAAASSGTSSSPAAATTSRPSPPPSTSPSCPPTARPRA